MPPGLESVADALRQVTEQDLRDLVGETSLERGRQYAAEERVGKVSVAAPLVLAAHVRGQGRTYWAQVRLTRSGSLVEGWCTCPVGLDCKHVAALVLQARARLDEPPLAPRPIAPGAVGSGVRVGAAAPRSDWERLLGGVLGEPQADPAFARLGLLFSGEAPRTRRYSSSQIHTRIRLRPVVPGKTGWVRTGISWSRLDHPSYGTPRLDPRQLAAVQSLARSRNSTYSYYSPPEWLSLDSLGHQWPSALRRCSQAGVALLTDQRRSGLVRVAEEPAAVRFDVVRLAAGDIRVTPSVELPDDLDPDDAVETWLPIGLPATGVYAWHGADLLLAAFEPALDAELASILDHGPFEVPDVEAARFLAEAAPVLARRFTVTSPDASVLIPEAIGPRLRLEIAYLPGMQLGLAWSFSYAVGERTLSMSIDSPEHRAIRDQGAEAEIVAAVAALPLPPIDLTAAGFDGTARLHPRRTMTGFDVVTFLDGALPLIEAVDDVEVAYTGERVDYREVIEPPTVNLSLTDAGGEDPDWFDLTVEVKVGGREVPIATLVTALTLGQAQVILDDGTWFRVDRPELAELQRLIDEARALQDRPGGTLRLSPFHADLWAELEALGVVAEQSQRWAQLVKGLTSATSEALVPPAGLTAELRPYQHDGFEWLTFLRRHGLGGILADDMGLGKTVQALAMILQERQDIEEGERLPWLVVAPTSVLPTWAAEAERFAPSLRVRVLSDTRARRRTPVADEATGADLVVTSYAVLRLDAEQFLEVDWAGLVLDEAQNVKNHQSVTYQCVRKLTAGSRFAVTGTPMENNLMELWSLLSIVAPGMFASPKRFAEHFRKPIESGSAPERLGTLRRRIRPVMLRRTKEAVATDLPAKQEQLISVELPPRHRRLYDRGLARERQRVLGLLESAGRNRVAIFRALTLLRRLSLHPGLVEEEHRGLPCVKLDTLMELLGPVLAEGHQALVFSQFTSFLALVRDRLDAEGVAYTSLDGRTRRRDLAIERFRSGEARVFLISLKAGGTGLTLTEADYVFLLDPWWNPAVEAQAVDRTHRIGQDKPVNVYRLVAGATIEDKVIALQERKRELFSTVVDDGALAGALTDEEIRSLLD